MKSRTEKRKEIYYLDKLTVDTKIIRETKEKMEQYGAGISVKHRKSEYEKTQKERMLCSATESEAKRAMTDMKHNYLHEI